MTARILLVEDDAVARELISALLCSRGHEVDVVNEGFAALRMAQERSYDLAFVDYHLPEMDGYALARLLRTLSVTANPTLKMVAVTADQFGLVARRGADSIFDRMLAKPLDPDALFAVVDEFLVDGSRPVETAGGVAEAADDERRSAQSLWRMHGLHTTPSAFVVPTPSPDQRSRLEHCFRIAETEAADCLVVLDRNGFTAVEMLRAQGKDYLQPILVLDPALGPEADAVLDLSDGKSWNAVATLLANFAERRQRLNPSVPFARDFDTRVTAFLCVANRALGFTRDEAGVTEATYVAGFARADLIDAVKRLAGIGRLSAKLAGDDSARRLDLTLTAKGLAAVSGEGSGRKAGCS